MHHGVVGAGQKSKVNRVGRASSLDIFPRRASRLRGRNESDWRIRTIIADTPEESSEDARPHALSTGAVTATIVASSNDCHTIYATQVAGGVFTIFIHDPLNSCHGVDDSFMFQVVGR